MTVPAPQHIAIADGEPVSGVKSSTGSGLRLEVVTTEERFAQLEPAWDALAASAPVTIYQTYPWAALWWRHMGQGKGRRLHILLWYDDRQLVAILPAFTRQSALIGVPAGRALHLLGSGEAFERSGSVQFDDGPSDYLDALVVPEYAGRVADALVSYLRSNREGINRFYWVNIPESSVLAGELIPRMEAGGMPFRRVRADRTTPVVVPASVELYLTGLSASVRRRCSQAFKAVQNPELMRIHRVGSPDELGPAMADLIRMHQNRWNSLGFTGLFWRSESRNFQEAVAGEFLERGWLWFTTVSSDGTSTGARCAFMFRGRYYDYLTGFDDRAAMARHRPGLGLMMLLIRDAAESGAAVVDLLRGDEPYKTELSERCSYNTNMVIGPWTAGSFLPGAAAIPDMLLFRLGKEWTLFRVQARVHGFPGCIPKFLAFRFGRILSKVNRHNATA